MSELGDSSPAAAIARSPAAWEGIAKSWLMEVVERTPLGEADQIPIAWISHEAAPLIAEILGQLSDPGLARDATLPPSASERVASLAAERGTASLGARLPRELAALQALLIESLERELPGRDRREFGRAVARLAEVFGSIQSAVMTAVLAERPAATSTDPETGLPGPAELSARAEELIEDERRTGVPFALALFDIEGIERIAKGYGKAAASQMVRAVAGVLRGRLSERDRAFRVGQGQLAALVPEREVPDVVAMATGVAATVESSQIDRGPRIQVIGGVAAFPVHGGTARELLEAAEEAAWSARACGESVALAGAERVQDS